MSIKSIIKYILVNGSGNKKKTSFSSYHYIYVNMKCQNGNQPLLLGRRLWLVNITMENFDVNNANLKNKQE